ncbi:MAG TPA: DUF423 domain-containing protein [Ignavibacteria bacterium]|nr:DUF423 domain-containing protein [Ignavibacteria bacterium]
MNTQKVWIIISSIMGFLGVATGAFGAHILKSQLSAEMLEIFKTGVLYQLIHSAVMLSVALSGIQKYLRSEVFFLAGVILFSFSLYLYSATGIKFFAMITPVGGISFLTGWIMLILKAIKQE